MSSTDTLCLHVHLLSFFSIPNRWQVSGCQIRKKQPGFWNQNLWHTSTVCVYSPNVANPRCQVTLGYFTFEFYCTLSFFLVESLNRSTSKKFRSNTICVHRLPIFSFSFFLSASIWFYFSHWAAHILPASGGVELMLLLFFLQPQDWDVIRSLGFQSKSPSRHTSGYVHKLFKKPSRNFFGGIVLGKRNSTRKPQKTSFFFAVSINCSRKKKGNQKGGKVAKIRINYRGEY